MSQMPNVQSIYVKRAYGEADDDEEKEMLRCLRPESKLKIKNFLVRRNEIAARAYSRFPTEADLNAILGKSKPQSNKVVVQKLEASFSLLQESTMLLGDQHGNFSEFLAGRVPNQVYSGSAHTN